MQAVLIGGCNNDVFGPVSISGHALSQLTVANESHGGPQWPDLDHCCCVCTFVPALWQAIQN